MVEIVTEGITLNPFTHTYMMARCHDVLNAGSVPISLEFIMALIHTFPNVIPWAQYGISTIGVYSAVCSITKPDERNAHI